MPQLLIRDVSPEAKRALRLRAAQNGRTQNAEARAILEEALVPARKPSLYEFFRSIPVETGGDADLPLPAREPARDLAFEV